MQTPAFLCRQTNFILNVCALDKPVNIKKGQFLAPLDMVQVANKAKSTGNKQIMVCERGASFGYNNLVSDMRSLALMRQTGCPVVYGVPPKPLGGHVRWAEFLALRYGRRSFGATNGHRCSGKRPTKIGRSSNEVLVPYLAAVI
jgi:hypothetical protein